MPSIEIRSWQFILLAAAVTAMHQLHSSIPKSSKIWYQSIADSEAYEKRSPSCLCLMLCDQIYFPKLDFITILLLRHSTSPAQILVYSHLDCKARRVIWRSIKDDGSNAFLHYRTQLHRIPRHLKRKDRNPRSRHHYHHSSRLRSPQSRLHQGSHWEDCFRLHSNIPTWRD